MSESKSFMRNFRREIESDINAFKSELNKQLVAGTPVRTGKARHGWEELTAFRLTGQTQTLIQNRLPYIGVLNAGSSRQAPRGIVDPAFDRAIRRRK